MMESIHELVSLLAFRVAAARDTQAALDSIAGSLGLRWDLRRASVIMFRPDGKGRFVASWPEADTQLEQGLEVPVDLTPDSLALSSQLVRGNAVLVRTGEVDLGLLGALLRLHGVAAAVGLPLHDEDGAVIGVLALGSYRRDGFTPTDVTMLEQLVPTLERALVTLASAE